MLWKRLSSLALVAALMIGGSVITAAPADAAATWVYISMPTWLGNCPRGGSVRLPQVSSWSLSATDYRSDFGDDLVYIKVGLRERTTIVAGGLCYSGGRSWPAAASSHSIYATRQGQTFWVGPSGVRNN